MWRILFIAIIISFTSCTDDAEETYVSYRDTIPPKITLNGLEIDTAFLNTFYNDKKADLMDEMHGNMRCLDGDGHMVTTGYVDTRIPGTYTLTYKGTDMNGNESASLSRTVHVVPNAVEYLSGDYLVTYTCTTFYRGSSNSTVTTGNYKAVVKPSSNNNHFELISLYVGPQYIVPGTHMEGDKMSVGFWHQDYQRADAKANLSLDKNSFIIETSVYLYTPEYYTCVNVFKKQLIIKTLAQK